MLPRSLITPEHAHILVLSYSTELLLIAPLSAMCYIFLNSTYVILIHISLYIFLVDTVI